MPSVFDPLLPTATEPEVHWGELYGGALALAIATAAQRHGAPVLVLAAGAREAERLGDELRFFAAADLPVLGLPDYETLPYDVFSPHPDITSQRLATLAALPGLRRGLVVLAVDALLMRLPPPSFVAGHTLVLAAGERLDLEAFRGRLAAAGYASVTQVAAPGEYAHARLADRPVADGRRGRRYRIDLFDDRRREHPRLRPRDAALAATSSSGSACCRRASSR